MTFDDLQNPELQEMVKAWVRAWRTLSCAAPTWKAS